MSSRAGYVLVGGKSSRMGRDKALLPFHGSTLVQAVAEAVRAAAGTVSLVGNPRTEGAEAVGAAEGTVSLVSKPRAEGLMDDRAAEGADSLMGKPRREGAEAVRAAAGTVSLVGNPRTEGLVSYRAVPDLYPGGGPLGGILTALEHSRVDWNLIVACDMPRLSADFLGQLLVAAECCEGDALVPTGPSGRLEPLCAVYHRRSRYGLHAAFARGIRKIAGALEEIRTVTWPVPEGSYFQNVNTPEDWAPYEQ